VDRVGNRRHRRHDRHLAGAADTLIKASDVMVAKQDRAIAISAPQ
jgi:hypothetical protein